MAFQRFGQNFIFFMMYETCDTGHRCFINIHYIDCLVIFLSKFWCNSLCAMHCIWIYDKQWFNIFIKNEPQCREEWSNYLTTITMKTISFSVCRRRPNSCKSCIHTILEKPLFNDWSVTWMESNMWIRDEVLQTRSRHDSIHTWHCPTFHNWLCKVKRHRFLLS